jgi:hypothetical protein
MIRNFGTGGGDLESNSKLHFCFAYVFAGLLLSELLWLLPSVFSFGITSENETVAVGEKTADMMINYYDITCDM